MFRLAAAAFLFAPTWASGQAVEWRGPLSGLLFDPPTQSLRPILGVPGGAYLGEPVAGNIQAASIAPDGNAAIIRRDGQVLLLESLRTGEAKPIASADARIEHAAWSSNSRMAVLSMTPGNRLLKVRIGAAPAIEEIAFPEGDVRAMAANEDGSTVLIATSDALYRIANSAAERIAPLTGPASCIFNKAAGGFFVLQEGGRRLTRVSATWEAISLESASGDPAGMAISRDGKRLYLARPESIRVHDTATGALLFDLALTAAPEQLAEVSAASGVFVLTARRESADPVWLLDTRSTPAVFFVPGEATNP